jgi:hypothetical protein
MLESLVQALASDLELDQPLEKDAEGCFWLELTPEQRISFRETSQGILLKARIAPYPTTKQEETLTHLMKANFLGQGTGDAVIGVDETGKFLTLCHALTYDMNYALFKQALEQFANYLDTWQGLTK